MNKITGNLSAFFVVILIWQGGCAAENRSDVAPTSPTVPAVSPVKTIAAPQITAIDIKTAETEAQALLDAGIKFDEISNADGGTADGGLSTGHGYKTSDGVEISTGRALHKREKNAKEDCGEVLKQADKILKKERILDGERVIATLKDDWFVVVIRAGNVCNTYSSSSLKHLLAFEKWRDD